MNACDRKHGRLTRPKTKVGKLAAELVRLQIDVIVADRS